MRNLIIIDKQPAYGEILAELESLNNKSDFKLHFLEKSTINDNTLKEFFSKLKSETYYLFFHIEGDKENINSVNKKNITRIVEFLENSSCCLTKHLRINFYSSKGRYDSIITDADPIIIKEDLFYEPYYFNLFAKFDWVYGSEIFSNALNSNFSVFLSHYGGDTDKIIQFRAILDRLKINSFIFNTGRDYQNIDSAESEKIFNSMKNATVQINFISTNYLERKACLFELGYSYSKRYHYSIKIEKDISDKFLFFNFLKPVDGLNSDHINEFFTKSSFQHVLHENGFYAGGAELKNMFEEFSNSLN